MIFFTSNAQNAFVGPLRMRSLEHSRASSWINLRIAISWILEGHGNGTGQGWGEEKREGMRENV